MNHNNHEPGDGNFETIVAWIGVAVCLGIVAIMLMQKFGG